MTRVAENIQYLKELLSDIPPGTGRHRKCLKELADWYETKFVRTNDTSDIEESIKYGRLALNATHYSSDLDRDSSPRLPAQHFPYRIRGNQHDQLP
jgi:hypothetical protein